MTKSDLVRRLMGVNLMIGAPISRKRLAYILGISKAYLDNKLHRDSFSFEDIIAIATIYGYKFIIVDRDGITVDALDPKAWLDENILFRLKDEKEAHREEYDRLKEQLRSMKETYGYKD